MRLRRPATQGMRARLPFSPGLRETRGPRLVAPGTTSALRTAMTFHKILCPIDFSPGAREAMRVAAELARDSGAPLVLAHAWDRQPWLSNGPDYAVAPSVLQDVIDSAEAELASWKISSRKLGAKEVATRFLTGVPWDQIVSAARDDRTIDLVVMGTHGRTGLSHVLLGSVAEKVVRHAPCAVLVVRPGAGR